MGINRHGHIIGRRALIGAALETPGAAYAGPTHEGARLTKAMNAIGGRKLHIAMTISLFQVDLA